MRSKKAEGEETAKNAKTSKNACKERSSHKDDPPEAIFHDFASILELPGEPEMTQKQPKEESEKRSPKTLYSLTEPQLAPGASQTQNLSNCLPI